MALLLNSFLYLLAVINPVSKVAVLVTLRDRDPTIKLPSVALRATAAGLGILLAFAVLGNILLTWVFHVELDSFRIAGGLVLGAMGFRALTKGVFFELDRHTKLSQLSIVPLASPMIAGPGTITVVIGFATELGIGHTAVVTLAALAANLCVMLLSDRIGRVLKHFNVMGALIRITGLIILTMGIQMVMTGLTGWLAGK